MAQFFLNYDIKTFPIPFDIVKKESFDRVLQQGESSGHARLSLLGLRLLLHDAFFLGLCNMYLFQNFLSDSAQRFLINNVVIRIEAAKCSFNLLDRHYCLSY